MIVCFSVKKERNMSFNQFLEIFPLKNIIIYLVVINIIGFLAMLIDKQKAKRGAWRIPEKTLFILTLLRRRCWDNCWDVLV